MSRIQQTFVIALVLIGATIVQCQQNTTFICTAQTTCAKCIQASPQCQWCAAPNFVGARCYSTDSNTVCAGTNNTQSPRSSVVSTSNEDFTNFNQISPQTIELNIRRGEPATFPLRVRPARNYPLDLYLLMDLSYSMNDDLANLKRLGDRIATTIAGITTNYNLGFGAFVDKPVAPYVSTIPTRLNDPCNGGCEGPYSFKHFVSLGNNSDTFNDGVQARRISGNLDSPEGGFDGFLQSIVCSDLIGWRRNARHLILYITDAGFHYAGDGKLGGAVLPHSGQCLMPGQVGNAEVDYEYYNVFDYPSVGQIRAKLREFDIIPLFAATSGARSFYDALARELSAQGADVGTLAGDSSNVLTLIQESYDRVSQRIIISPDNVPGLSFNITPVECPQINGQECLGVQIEGNATFNITANLLQCTPELINTRTSVNFRVLGFGSFIVHINTLCECECEGVQVGNSSSCNNNGTFTCGICECNEGRFGDMCQCDSAVAVSNTDNSTMCNNGPNGLLCSGRGICLCGRCECQTFDNGQQYFGATCQCDNFQCDRDPTTGQICGGPQRGVCSCDGQCECLTSPISGLQYTGSACDCDPDNATCISPGAETVCSGRGECMCGQCMCTTEGYTGQFCQICTNISACPIASCNNTQLCAQCANNLLTDGCEQCDGNVTRVNNVGTDYMIDGQQAVVCDLTDENNCEYRYFVALDDSGNTRPIHVDDNVVCPTRVAPWIIAVSIIGALLLIGLLILAAIKLLLMLLDYIEVKKFMAEVQDPKFRKNENPLFQSPNKEYKNPVYGK